MSAKIKKIFIKRKVGVKKKWNLYESHHSAIVHNDLMIAAMQCVAPIMCNDLHPIVMYRIV